MTTLYLAGPYASRDWLRTRVLPHLERAGHTNTATWLTEAHEISYATTGPATGLHNDVILPAVETNLADIGTADVVVMVTPDWIETTRGVHVLDSTTGGRHVEVGYAIGRGKPVAVLGAPENVFHRHPSLVTCVPNVDQLVTWLDRGPRS